MIKLNLIVEIPDMQPDAWSTEKLLAKLPETLQKAIQAATWPFDSRVTVCVVEDKYPSEVEDPVLRELFQRQSDE